MIRVRHETLPAGLSAVVRRRPGGDTDIVVSTALSPARQRAAVREGLRAARPERRRRALPVPLLGILALAWASARAVVRSLRMHPAALVAAAGVVTAATVVVAVIPHQHGPVAGGVQAPAPAQTTSGRNHGTARATGPPPPGRPSPSIVPVAAHSPSSAPRPSPGGRDVAPSPGTSGTGQATSGPPSGPPPPQPSPTPSPSAGGGGRICLYLLGIRVCL